MGLNATRTLLKNFAIKSINATGVSSKYCGTPKAIMRTEDWVRSKGKSYGAGFLPLIAAQTVVQQPPLTLDQTVHKIFRDEYRFEQWPAFMAVIPGGRVWSKNCAVITPDDVLLEDVSREFGVYGGKMGKAHSINAQLKLHSCRTLQGKVAVIGAAGSHTYHHWLYDVMPRLHLLQLAGVLEQMDHFVVDYQGHSFQKQCLDKLGIPESKIIRAFDTWKFHVEAETLYVPSLPARLGVTSKWCVDFLRSVFLKEKKPQPFRLYISRKKAPSRKLINEAEVLDFFRKKGFIEFYAEDYLIEETAAYFAAAEYVAGVHGAGFSNCAFLSKGTKVLDIVAPRHVDGNFWTLTNFTAGSFAYLFGEGERPSEDLDLIRTKVDEDITVNMADLEKIFEKLEQVSLT